MLFRGERRSFSCAGSRQYESIGAFWDEMRARFPGRALVGLGWLWREEQLDYAIGWEEWVDAPFSIRLPDEGWQRFLGRTEAPAQLYERIYQQGALTYELERFFPDGSCEIMIWR